MASRKSSLEAAKVGLEVRALRRSLTRSGRFLQWMQAASVPIAAASLIATIVFQTYQISSASDAQHDDLYQRLVSRLTSKDRSERLSGVFGFQEALPQLESKRARSTCIQLLGSLEMEEDQIVQDALVETLTHGDGPCMRAGTRDEMTRRVIAANQVLAKNLREASDGRHVKRLRDQVRSLLHLGPAESGADLTGEVYELDNELDMLSPTDSMGLDVYAGAYDFVTEAERRMLRGAGRLLTRLASGSNVKDLSNIYCEECDFSRGDLAGANFKDSFLRGSDFSFSSLQGSSFDGADLRNVIFYGADLRRSNMRFSSERDENHQEVLAAVRRSSWDAVAEPPRLDCADLRGADLAGRPLAWVEIDYDRGSPGAVTPPPDDPRKATRHAYVWVPALGRARIDRSTNFRPVTFVWSVGIGKPSKEADEDLFSRTLPGSRSAKPVALQDVRGTAGESASIRLAVVEASEVWGRKPRVDWIDRAVSAALADMGRGSAVDGRPEGDGPPVEVTRSDARMEACTRSETMRISESGLDWFRTSGT